MKVQDLYRGCLGCERSYYNRKTDSVWAYRLLPLRVSVHIMAFRFEGSLIRQCSKFHRRPDEDPVCPPVVPIGQK